VAMADRVDSPLTNIVEQIDRFLEPWNRSDAPGFVIGVAKDERPIYRRGFGMASLETFVSNSPATRMRIASVSKHFTSLIALLLEEKGKLNIDVPIRSYISELTGPDGDPTLRELMHHRGGIRDFLDIGMIVHGLNPWPAGSALKLYAKQLGRNFLPGDAMIYNNGGYHLLSVAIERAGGAPFESLLQDLIFNPLGMNTTSSVPSDYVITPGIATMHVPDPNGGWRRGLFISEEMRGEGGMVSTIDDMLRWLAHLRHPNVIGSRRVWSELRSRASSDKKADDYYALGLYVTKYRGIEVIGHSGGVMGGTCHMCTVPEHDLDIIVICNGAPGARSDKIADRIIDIVLAEDLSTAKSLSAQNYSEYLGRWWSPASGMIYNICNNNGAIKVALFDEPNGTELIVDQANQLCLRGEGLGDITFEPNGRDLAITFGTQVSVAERLLDGFVLSENVQAQMCGTFFCCDADTMAIVECDCGQLILRFRDQIGGAQSKLIPVNEKVALAGPFAEAVYCAISFEREAGAITAFQLNSQRTRNLRFERVNKP
jgi:D-aminopeptidase